MIAPRVGLGGDNSGVDAIECFHNVIPNGTETIGHLTPSEKLWTAIYGNLIQARHTAPGFEWYDTGDGSDEKRWRMEVDANSDLRLITLTDLGVPGSTVFKVDRVADSTDLVNMKFGTHLVPDTTATYDLGESGTPLKWRAGYFSAVVGANGLQVQGADPGGAVNAIRFVYATAAAGTIGGDIYASGNNMAGFIKVYINHATNPSYIPYWTTI